MPVLKNHLKLIASDLDGTIHLPDNPVSSSTLYNLQKLGEMGIIRVIATGRSLYSAQKVLDDNFPIDYLVLSSGAALMDWRTKKMIFTRHLERRLVNKITPLLKQNNLDFMLHDPFPGNHFFYYFHNGHKNTDFEKRCILYKDFAKPLADRETELSNASQFVIILRPQQIFPAEVYQHLADVNIIRTTSPLDFKTQWMEILPKQVCKSSAIQFICNKFGISREEIITIGNDYNDLDMLKMTRHSYVLDSAPPELRESFNVLQATTENALETVIMKYCSRSQVQGSKVQGSKVQGSEV